MTSALVITLRFGIESSPVLLDDCRGPGNDLCHTIAEPGGESGPIVSTREVKMRTQVPEVRNDSNVLLDGFPKIVDGRF